MKRFVGPGIAAFALCSIAPMAIGGVAHAQDPPAPPAEEVPAPAPDATSMVTLTLVGTPLVVNVTTDAGGGLVDVTLEPADGYDPAAARPNKVAFVNEETGVSVKVSAKRGGERVEARAGALTEISGASGWSGDVFDSGETTSVGFTIGAADDGGPNITDVTVDSPLENVVGEVRRKGDDGRQSARVSIEFTRSGQTRVLTIKATTFTGRDGEQHSSLKVGLSRIHGRLLADGAAVGPHSWSGQLCDGTAASFTYNVTEAGEVTDVVATPDADVRADGRRANVAFSQRERVSVKVRGEGAEMTVGTSEKIRCERTDPTVNGEQVDLPDNGWGDGHRGDHGGWWKGDGDRRDHDDGDGRRDREGRDGDGRDRDGDHDGSRWGGGDGHDD
jgi:hypothetical protein